MHLPFSTSVSIIGTCRENRILGSKKNYLILLKKISSSYTLACKVSKKKKKNNNHIWGQAPFFVLSQISFSLLDGSETAAAGGCGGLVIWAATSSAMTCLRWHGGHLPVVERSLSVGTFICYNSHLLAKFRSSTATILYFDGHLLWHSSTAIIICCEGCPLQTFIYHGGHLFN